MIRSRAAVIAAAAFAAWAALASCRNESPRGQAGTPAASASPATASAPGRSGFPPVPLASVRDDALELKNINDYDMFRNKVLELALTRRFAPTARELGLDRTDVEVIRKMTRFKEEKLGDLYLNRVIVPTVKVTEGEYDVEIAKMTGGTPFEDMVNLRALLPADPAKADEIRAAAAGGAGFDALMAKYGTESGKRTQGKIGFITRSNTFIPDESKELVFTHALGRIFGPVPTYVGNLFLLVDERYTAAEARAFAKRNLEPTLRSANLRKATNAECERLKKKYAVVVYKPEENVVEHVGGKAVRVFARAGSVLVTTDTLGSDEGHRAMMDRERRLQRILCQIVFFKAAEERGLDKDPAYRKDYERALDDALFAAYKAHVFGQALPPATEEELKTFFDRRRKDLFEFASQGSYLVLKGADPARTADARKRIAAIGGRGQLEAAAKEMGLASELVLRRDFREIPEPVRRALSTKVDNDVFDLPGEGGKRDVYKVIHLEIADDPRPEFRTIRGRVEQVYDMTRRSDRLTEFMDGQIRDLGYADKELSALYAEYQARVRRDEAAEKARREKERKAPGAAAATPARVR